MILGESLPANVDTIFLVDVDGVLNVGAREESGIAPLLLDSQNADRAFRLFQRPNSDVGMLRSAERMVSVWTRCIPEDFGKTYANFVCDSAQMLSPVLVGRLARLLRAAEGNWAAVLSSSWRKAKHIGRVRALEAAISVHLGRRFAFHAATPLQEERCASDRLQCLKAFIEEQYESREAAGVVGRPLRMIILEDFFISPPSQWGCYGCPLNSIEAGEEFLKGSAPLGANLSVKIIHTYDEWATGGGLRVAIGAGLHGRAMREALSFLQESRYSKTQLAPMISDVNTPAGKAGSSIGDGESTAASQSLPGSPSQTPSRPPSLDAARLLKCWYMLPAWPWLAAVELGMRPCAQAPAAVPM